MVRKRLKSVLRTAARLFAAGTAYGIFLHFTGIGLVCPVNFVTGLKCPGCGVSHMCLALARLDFAAAFAANPALFLLSPVLAIILIQYITDYIRKGRWKLRPFQNIVIWICTVILILYGIARNM